MLPRKGIQELSEGLGPDCWSDFAAGIEYTLPLEDRAITRSRDRMIDFRFFPVRVGVGKEFSVSNPFPHCSRSPFSVMAAPKFLSSLISLSNKSSKNGMRLGVLMKDSSESGAITFPALDPHA